MSVNVNTTTNTITIQQDATRVVQVSTAGPRGPQGPVAEGGVENYISRWSSSENLSTSSIYEAAINRIIIGATASIHEAGTEEAFAVYQGVTDSYNLISGHSEVNSYSQLNIKNFSNGYAASSDVVATADNGTEEFGYIDMGINSSEYTSSALVGAQNDGYLYSSGNDLYIGNVTPNKRVIIFNGGYDALNNSKVFIHENGTVGINTDTNDTVNVASLRVFAPNPEADTIIRCETGIDDFVQNVLVNSNGGADASADLVIENDLGTDTAYYLDMGINSSGYNAGFVGGPNDTYLIGTGEHFHIGNVGHTPGSDASLYLYTGGSTDDYTRIYISASGEVGINTLTPEYSFDVSGSARITDGLIITGSATVTGSSFTWNNNQVLTTPSATTGTVVSFTTNQVYNEWDVPGTGNITANLTGAKTGIVQKIYHNHSTAPSVPMEWVVVSNGVYVPNTLNIIYAEWVKGTRVEYWITQ